MSEELQELIEKNQCERGYEEGKKFHHPTPKSGVTCGPGIDTKQLKPKDVEKKYMDCLTPNQLKVFIKSCGLTGKEADNFVKQNKNFELSKQSYNKLIKAETKFCQAQVERIMTKDDMVKKYGKFDYTKDAFKQLPKQYKDVMADMRYNGRFTKQTRQQFVPLLAQYVKHSRSGNFQKMQEIRQELNKRIVTIYKNPNVGNLRNDQRRGSNIQNFIKIKDDNFNKTYTPNNPQNGSAKKQAQFFKYGQKVLNDITNNNNKLGGVDLGFDLCKYRFSGVYCGQRGYALKDSINSNDISLNDLVVPLKIMLDNTIQSKNISVSLDPQVATEPDGPLYKKVYYPIQLEGTPMGNAMIQADYLMKQLNLGVDQHNQPFKYPQSLINIGMDFHSISTKYPKNDNTLERARLWIVVEDAQIAQKENNVIEVGEVKMGLKAIMQEVGSDGKLKDGEKDISQHNKQFVRLFCKNYQILENEYPVFSAIRRYAKAAILARILLEKRCPINMLLIENLYRDMKSQSPKTKNRLQNKIQRQIQNGMRIRRICGGCDLNINKPSLVKKLPLQCVDTNKIDLVNNYSYFIFQELQKCIQKNCNKLCNTDYFSMLNKQCSRHSKMRCPNCLDLIMLGEKYLPASQDINYHPKCLMCNGCENQINPEQINKITNKQNFLYHFDCYPVGVCYICEQIIHNGEKNGAVDGKKLHIKCYEKQRAQISETLKNGMPQCEKCKKEIEGSYKTDGSRNWHAQCYIQPVCQICQKPKGLSLIGTRKVHLCCLSCQVCKKQLDMANQFGCTADGKYIHVKCQK